MKNTLKKLAALILALTILAVAAAAALAEDDVLAEAIPEEAAVEESIEEKPVEEEPAEEEPVEEELIEEPAEATPAEETPAAEMALEAPAAEVIAELPVAGNAAETSDQPFEETAEDASLIEIPDAETPLGLAGAIPSQLEENDQPADEPLEPTLMEDIDFSFDKDVYYLGDTVTMRVDLSAYEGRAFQLAWQTGSEGGWTLVSEGDAVSYSFVLTESNVSDYWKVDLYLL